MTPAPTDPPSRTPRRRLEQSAREWDELRELRQEARDLRSAARSRRQQAPSSVSSPVLAGFASTRGRARRRRRWALVLATAAVTIILAVTLGSAGGSADSFPMPSHTTLASMGLRARIVAIANSQVGYDTHPASSYCNKFSAYWDAGPADCPSGERSEQWCADFAAWAWKQAGVQFTYGFAPGDIDAAAASFYEWAVANGTWHPAGTGYVPSPGDVAVYGLSLGAEPTAAHVAIVTSDTAGQPGPDVVNGDGDRTGFSVVERGTDQVRADVTHPGASTLAGYAAAP